MVTRTPPTLTFSPTFAWILAIRPALGARDLDVGLVRQDRHEGSVLLDRAAFLDEPLDDLALGDALADVRKPELVASSSLLLARLHRGPSAAAIRSAFGR